MTTEIINIAGENIAVIESKELLITDVGSALDLAMSIHHNDNSNKIIIPKEAITEDFFKLSTCLAGEILQKFINYHMKIVIVGDFSGYTSKPLHDFIYESNNGKDIFFVETKEKAIEMLSKIH